MTHQGDPNTGKEGSMDKKRVSRCWERNIFLVVLLDGRKEVAREV